MESPRAKLEAAGLHVPREILDIYFARALDQVRGQPRNRTVIADDDLGVKQILFTMIAFLVNTWNRNTKPCE